MSDTSTPRSFLRTAGVAGAAAATAPTALRGAAGGQVVLAFVGVGHIHTPGFVKLLNGRADVRVKWVWDHEPARTEVRATDLGAQIAGSLDQVFSDPEVQAW